jgi:adenylate kinase family enzyme
MSDIENTSVSTNKLIEATYKSGIKTIVMIFDACRSFLTSTRIPVTSFGNLTAEISRRQGIISFFSCSPSEYAQELAELSHGIFTYALVESFKECKYRTPINLNKHIVDKVSILVQKNNLSPQIPYTTVGPIEKANLDIISGKEFHPTLKNKPICILIAGSSHSGKSDIGRYLAQQYNFGHYEMSSLAYKRYNEFKENNTFDGTIQDFLEKELWFKNENKDIIARDFIEQYDGSNNVVISGPRLIEEIETLLNYDWNTIPLYIYTEPKIRKERYNFLQKERSFFNELSLEEFIKRDMRELHWGLAKMATLEKFKMIINNNEINEFHRKAKEHTDFSIN